jgi:hypothetical protein
MDKLRTIHDAFTCLDNDQPAEDEAEHAERQALRMHLINQNQPQATSLAFTEYELRILREALETHLIEVRDAAGRFPWLALERETDIRSLLARIQGELLT